MNGLGWESPEPPLPAQVLPSSSPTGLGAGSRPACQEQVGSCCPVLRVTRPCLCPAPHPGRHSCGCDRRLGSVSPRHIPGPATIFFFW